LPQLPALGGLSVRPERAGIVRVVPHIAPATGDAANLDDIERYLTEGE